MKRHTILLFLLLISFASSGRVYDRNYWVKTMIRIVDPVFTNLSENRLRQNMPVEQVGNAGRERCSHLEALGRSFSGIAPWLALPADQSEEGKLRDRYLHLVAKSITNAVDPQSPDYMSFGGPERQALVDAAFFAHGLLRCKSTLWPLLSTQTRERVISELRSARRIKPGENNWLLFSAMTEACLLELTDSCKMETIGYALRKHREWYKGDGWYGDGPVFHLDYYNSYVIQPMLYDITSLLARKGLITDGSEKTALKRFVRFAVQQEKLISPEGTYPVIGRSMAYRFGAFQALSQVALMQQLPAPISPSQVREALTSVIKRQLVHGTFDKKGWLRSGFCGSQPLMADSYISTGSLYLCSVVFLPLGLPATDEFWSGKPAPWSSVQIWKGSADVKGDHAINN